MLEQRDLQAIAEIVDKRVEMLEQRDLQAIAEIVDKRVEMLEQRDLQAIAEIVDKRVEKTETILRGEMKEMKEELRQETRKQVEDTRDLLLDEMRRYNIQNEKRFAHLEKDVEEIKQYTRLRKLEERNDELLFRLYDSLRQDVTELQLRFA